MPAVGIIHRPAAPGIWQALIADADQDRHRIPAAEIVEIAVRHTSPGVLAGCEKYQQCGYEPCLFQFLYFNVNVTAVKPIFYAVVPAFAAETVCAYCQCF